MPIDAKAVFYADLGARVRRAREDRGLSQAALADGLRVTRSSVSNLEAGRQRPPLHVLGRVAALTGCEWSELLPPVELLAEPDPGESSYRDLSEQDLASVMLAKRSARALRPA